MIIVKPTICERIDLGTSSPAGEVFLLRCFPPNLTNSDMELSQSEDGFHQGAIRGVNAEIFSPR